MKQTTRQIINVLSSNSTYEFNLHGDHKAQKLDVSKLKQDSKRQAFISDICNHRDTVQLSSEDPEENSTVFRNTMHSSDVVTLENASRRLQDWFDENGEAIQGLLEENIAYTRHIKMILAQYQSR